MPELPDVEIHRRTLACGLLHFGMTGRLALEDDVEDPHTRMLFTFEGGRRLALVDQRRLGGGRRGCWSPQCHA
jgi:formamidopyrimidine-DNA glycosylase